LILKLIFQNLLLKQKVLLLKPLSFGKGAPQKSTNPPQVSTPVTSDANTAAHTGATTTALLLIKMLRLFMLLLKMLLQK